MISNHFIENNFPKGIVTLVGARPAIGKSAFAISMAILPGEIKSLSIFRLRWIKNGLLIG